MLAGIDSASQPAGHPWLEAVHIGILIAGGLAALVWTVHLVRSGRWRQPLAGVSGTVGVNLPYLTLALLVPLTYLALARVLTDLLPGAGTLDDRRTPGAAAWHVAYTVDSVAKLAGCALIVLLLSRYATFGREQAACGTGVPPVVRKHRRDAGATGFRAGFVAALIVVSVTTLQLAMGQVLWRWLHRDAAPPVHQVLEGIESSAWGALGVIQLCVTAVLVAPIAEEMFFRGLLLEVVYRFAGRAWVAIAVSAVAFGSVHSAQPQDVLPLATMGLILGYVRVRHRSLEACMIAHALFNARTMTFVLLAPELV